jgi:aspartokinase-like uncharacterized kinase
VKVGGGLAAQEAALDRTARALVVASRRHRLVVVPGGGPFADAVRAFDAVHGLSADAAHWMAIAAMNQYAYALADRIGGAVLVESAAEMAAAHAEELLPVLAPARWLRAADVLPHSWDATSDSAAAFLAGALDAAALVLVKPVGGEVPALTDAHFMQHLPRGLPVAVLAVDEVERLSDVVAGLAGRAGA